MILQCNISFSLQQLMIVTYSYYQLLLPTFPVELRVLGLRLVCFDFYSGVSNAMNSFGFFHRCNVVINIYTYYIYRILC